MLERYRKEGKWVRKLAVQLPADTYSCRQKNEGRIWCSRLQTFIRAWQLHSHCLTQEKKIDLLKNRTKSDWGGCFLFSFSFFFWLNWWGMLWLNGADFSSGRGLKLLQMTTIFFVENLLCRQGAVQETPALLTGASWPARTVATLWSAKVGAPHLCSQRRFLPSTDSHHTREHCCFGSAGSAPLSNACQMRWARMGKPSSMWAQAAHRGCRREHHGCQGGGKGEPPGESVTRTGKGPVSTHSVW